MRINTRTRKLELVKTERRLLANSVSLIEQLKKHGDSAIEALAEDALEHLEGLIEELNGGQTVNSEGEPVSAPY